jgi:hypothetical protein
MCLPYLVTKFPSAIPCRPSPPGCKLGEHSGPDLSRSTFRSARWSRFPTLSLHVSAAGGFLQHTRPCIKLSQTLVKRSQFKIMWISHRGPLTLQRFPLLLMLEFIWVSRATYCMRPLLLLVKLFFPCIGSLLSFVSKKKHKLCKGGLIIQEENKKEKYSNMDNVMYFLNYSRLTLFILQHSLLLLHWEFFFKVFFCFKQIDKIDCNQNIRVILKGTLYFTLWPIRSRILFPCQIYSRSL